MLLQQPQESQLPRIKCQQHVNENIIGFCQSQTCDIDEKVCCFTCKTKYQHLGCEQNSIENIPNQVKDHSNLYKETLTSLQDLENTFLGKTNFIKQIVEGYQIDETYQHITNVEDLNSMVKIMTTLPKVFNQIIGISNTIKNILEQCSIQQIQKLGKFQKEEELKKTILRRNETTQLLQTMRIQLNQQPQQIIPPIQENKSDKLEELMKKGEENLKSLQYKIAIQCFGEVLKLEPINIQAKVGLMNALQELNYFNTSLLFQGKILEQDPLNFDAVLNKGLMFYNQKKYSESIAYIQQKLVDNQFDSDKEKKLLKLLTNNLLENKQFQDARIQLNQILQKYGETIDVFQGLAKCELMQGNQQEAQKYIQKATQIDKNNLENKIIEVQLLKYIKEYEKCKNLIEDLQKRQLKNKDKEILMRLKPYIYFEQKQFQEAMVCCQQYLENNLADIDICQIFGKCLLENKIYLLSIHFFEKVLNQQKNHIDANYGKKQAKQKLNESNQLTVSQLNPINQRVIRTYQQQSIPSVASLTNDYQNLLEEAVSIIMRYDYSQAIQFIDRCIKGFPQIEWPLILKAKCYISTLDSHPEYKIIVAQSLNNALKINPYNQEAIYLQDRYQLNRPQTSFNRQQNYQ